MKKIIFWILSFLFISPVFADTIDLWSHFNNFISFESLNSSNNITYWWYSISNWFSPIRTDFFYLDSSLSPVYNIWYLESSYSSYWSSFDWFPFDFSWDTITNYSLNSNHYYWLLWIWFNNNKLINWFFSMYFQSINSSYLPNKVLNFGASPNSWFNYIYPHDSYIRALYSGSSFWFNNNSFPISSVSSAPSEIQIFTKWSDTFYDTKWLVSVNNQFISNISSSVWNWFSFVSDLWQLDTVYYDDLDFYSVLPYWDSSWSSSVSSFSIPSSSYVQWIYIFKNNSFSRNSNYEDIWVISKCNTVLCSWLDLTSYLSTLVVSNYLCDFSSNFWIKNNCILVWWWFLTWVLWFITWLDQPLTKTSLSLIFFDSKIVSTYYNSLWYSYSFLSSPYSLSLTHFVRDWSNHSVSTNSFLISYITWYSISNPPDILSTVNFSDNIPSLEPLTTWKVVDILDTLCNSSLIKPAFCNWVDQVSTWVDWFWDLDWSWNLIYTLINTDPNNMGWGDITPDWSWGFNITCSDQDWFWCPLLKNAWLSWYLDYWSWFILGTDYYETFFQKTGRFFACPYGYVVLDTNSFLKVLNKFNSISESIWFDFMLPINCSIAAFVHWKNYKFLKDVDLWLNPLMWHIQGPDDPRVYLYRFFDFLMSIAILFFLLKLYHLIF